jgi:integrase
MGRVLAAALKHAGDALERKHAKVAEETAGLPKSHPRYRMLMHGLPLGSALGVARASIAARLRPRLRERRPACRRPTSRARRAAARGRTVKQAADAWLEGARAGTVRNRKGRPYKPSALRGYERALQLRVLPALGHVRLSELRRADLQDLADRLLADGLDPSTVNNTLDPLRAIYRRALRREEVAVNPTIDLELPRPRGTASPHPRRAPGFSPPYPPRTARCGRRRSTQACAAGSSALCGGRTSTSRPERSASRVLGATRRARSTASRRPPSARCRYSRGSAPSWSAANFARAGAATPSSAAPPEGTFEPSTVRRRALAAWKQAGLAPIGLHEARHTFASVMIAAGVNAKAICEYMGHATITMTFDRYGHMLPGSRVEAAARVDAFLG